MLIFSVCNKCILEVYFFHFAFEENIVFVPLKYTICLYIFFVTMSMYIFNVHYSLTLLLYLIDVYKVITFNIIRFLCAAKTQYILYNSIKPHTKTYFYL